MVSMPTGSSLDLVVWQRRLTMCSLMALEDDEDCRVYHDAQFFNTDHRLVVSILKLQFTTGRMVPSQSRLNVSKLKDERLVRSLQPG